MRVKDTDFELYVIAAAITFFGAVVHATNQLRIARKNNASWTWTDFVILVPVSAFSGLIFGLFARLTSDNDIHLMLACGIGAFLGIAGLNRIAEIFIAVMTKGAEKRDSN